MEKRFSEEQIIGFLREAEAGLAVKDLCRRHGFVGGELLPVEVAVRWNVGAGGEEAEAPGDGEHAAEEAAGGDDAEGAGEPRGTAPKVVTAPAKRELVRYAQSQGLSERRALKLAGMSPSVLRYDRRDGDGL